MARGDGIRRAKAYHAERLKACRPALAESVEKLEKDAQIDRQAQPAAKHARDVLQRLDDAITDLEKPLQVGEEDES